MKCNAKLEKTWKCMDCGALLTKAEGGDVFSVCDDCYLACPSAALQSHTPLQIPAATRKRYERNHNMVKGDPGYCLSVMRMAEIERVLSDFGLDIKED